MLSLTTAFRGAITDVWISWRNVVRQGRRSFGGMLAVAFGTVALLLAAGFIEWTFWAMREGAIQAGLGHLQVTRTGYREHGTADPFAYVLPRERSAPRELVEQAAHVRTVAPRIKFTGLASARESSLSFLGLGLDPQEEDERQNVTGLVAGALLASDDPTGVLVGRGLAENLGLTVGDPIVLLANNRSGALDGVEGRVRGIFFTVAKAYDDVAVHVPFALADELLRIGGAHAWVIRLDATENTDAVAGYLKQRLPPEFTVTPWHEAADFYNKTVSLFSRQVLVMKLIIALVVVLTISNTMMMNVMERTSEIATALALGVRRLRVLRRFLLEGFLIGVLGGLAGAFVGFLLASAISAVGIPMPPPPGMAQGFSGEIMVTAPLVRDAFALACGTALAASVFPAWKAARMVIAEALRQGR